VYNSKNLLKMKKQITYGILALILSISTAYSQTPVQWTRTLQLEGLWQGEVTLILGGQTFLLDYYMNYQTVVDGSALTMDEGFSDEALGELKGANLIGLNAADGLIHWFSADNFGTAHEHVGSWSTTKKFHMEHHIMQDGLPFAEYIDLKLKANDQQLEARLIATLGTDTVQILYGTLVRQSSSRPANSIPAETTELTVFPNPTSGELTISSAEMIDEIIITNSAGQIVHKAKPAEITYQLKLQDAGIYYVQITSGRRTETEEVLITK
jgi:hypothetical protein